MASKTRTAGGVGMGLVLLGLLVGLMFKGPGLGGGGSGEGQGPGTDAGPVDLTNVKTESPAGDLFADDAQPRPATSTPAPTVNYVTVVIHGDGYRLSSDGDPQTGVPVELSELVERVKRAPGTPEGIRLRVLLHTSAREGARADLMTMLQTAGIKPEAIQEVSGFVE